MSASRMQARIFTTIIILATVVVGVTSAPAIGIIIPRKPSLSPPVLTDVSVSCSIKEHIARTRITQVFKNSNATNVEADYFFPVSKGANITDFVLYMNGKSVRGEVLDKSKAREIYRDIVRRLKDPGLIEWSEDNLFRVRIFPIPAHGEQKLEIELTQSLMADQGYYQYALPLKTGRHPAEHVRPSLKMDLTIDASAPVRNIYSPTHQIDTDTSSSEVARVTLKDDVLGERENFMLFYETSSSDVAVGLLTHRPSDQPGYFSLRISPPWKDITTTSQAADYIFVIDSSGSMSSDGKMEQAKNALKYCVSVLSPHDRFSVVRFSSAVDTFKPSLEHATADNVNSAKAWIEEIRPHGGTNIHDALETGLRFKTDSPTTSTHARLLTIVFVTDGLPTVGQTSPDKIIKTIDELAGDKIRIFTFGLGNDVNTRLLDAIAEKANAVSDYIGPETDLEVPISRFFDKVSRPALVDAALDFGELEVFEVFPPDLSDLFYGTEIAVYGRYRTPGSTTVTLTGTIGSIKKSYDFPREFPATEPENTFIEKLWATRKVAWLLDQVRMSGESEELKSEITELARKYSIVTPYTSYLAMEDEPLQPSRVPASRVENRFYGPESQRPALMAASDKAGFASEQAFQRSSGAEAVGTARRIRAMKSADVAPAAGAGTQQLNVVGGKTFTVKDGVWVDEAISGQEPHVVKIKVYSEAWFHLVDNYPELRQFLEANEKIRVRLKDGAVLEVGDNGIESIELMDLKQLGLNGFKEN